MGDEWIDTWVVRAGAQARRVSRHLGHERDGTYTSTCQAVCDAECRQLSDDELALYAPCGFCLAAEAAGPADTRAEAMSVIRDAATACAEASMLLDELGHHRMASRMRTLAERSYSGAESMEVYS